MPVAQHGAAERLGGGQLAVATNRSRWWPPSVSAPCAGHLTLFALGWGKDGGEQILSESQMSCTFREASVH